jgi:hypothetical protein
VPLQYQSRMVSLWVLAALWHGEAATEVVVVAACVGAATASAPTDRPTVARLAAMIVPRVISSQSVDVACPPQYIGPHFQNPFILFGRVTGWLGLYSGGRGLVCGFIMIGSRRGT